MERENTTILRTRKNRGFKIDKTKHSLKRFTKDPGVILTEDITRTAGSHETAVSLKGSYEKFYE